MYFKSTIQNDNGKLNGNGRNLTALKAKAANIFKVLLSSSVGWILFTILDDGFNEINHISYCPDWAVYYKIAIIPDGAWKASNTQ